MKKTILHVLLLILILSMISCNSSQTPPTEHTSPDTLGATAPEATAPEHTDGEDEGVAAEIPSTVISSLKGYQNFITEKRLPDDFVAYEQLSAFGSFQSFVYYPSSYHYNLRDPNGKKLFVSVRKTKKNDYKVLHSAQDDLRTYSDSASGVLKLDLAEYLYSSGKLYSISIPCGEMTVAVTISEKTRLSDYPTDADTLLSRLVNRDTAEAAVQELAAQLNQKGEKN